MYDPWAEKVTGVQNKHFSKTKEELEASSCKATLSKKDPAAPGLGSESQRKGQRATESVKNFLREKFNKGVKTGNYITKRIFLKSQFSKCVFKPFLSFFFFTFAGECSFVQKKKTEFKLKPGLKFFTLLKMSLHVFEMC